MREFFTETLPGLDTFSFLLVCAFAFTILWGLAYLGVEFRRAWRATDPANAVIVPPPWRVPIGWRFLHAGREMIVVASWRSDGYEGCPDGALCHYSDTKGVIHEMWFCKSRWTDLYGPEADRALKLRDEAKAEQH